MTNLEWLQSLSKEQLIEWLLQHASQEGPWDEWWSRHFCSRCPTVTGREKSIFTGRPLEQAYCEVGEKCCFFPELPDFPDRRIAIDMWLTAPYE